MAQVEIMSTIVFSTMASLQNKGGKRRCGYCIAGSSTSPLIRRVNLSNSRGSSLCENESTFRNREAVCSAKTSRPSEIERQSPLSRSVNPPKSRGSCAQKLGAVVILTACSPTTLTVFTSDSFHRRTGFPQLRPTKRAISGQSSSCFELDQATLRRTLFS